MSMYRPTKGADDLPLFGAAAQARDEAIARADANARPEWRDAALEAVREIARTQREFIVDELWQYVTKPREARAAGAVMLHAARLGWIERTGEYRASEQVGNHANPRAVWASRIYEGARDAA